MNNSTYHFAAKSPKVFIFDWWVIVPTIILFVHFRLWTLGFYLLILLFSFILNILQLPLPMLGRKLRYIFSFSNHKSIRSKRRIKQCL